MEKDAKQSADDKKIVVRIRKKQDPGQEPLFTQAEIKRMVSEFVSSWIRGDIIIRFPTAAELSKKTPLSIAFPVDPSVNAELKIKEHYIDLLSILAGIKKASANEQEKAMEDVFKMLLMFRSANRIEGKIISNDIEKRVADIEKNLNQNTRLVEQITGYLFKEKKKPTMSKKREG
jgi:hypothetical protein